MKIGHHLAAAATCTILGAFTQSHAAPVTWEFTGTVVFTSTVGSSTDHPVLATMQSGDPFTLRYTFDDATPGELTTDEFGANVMTYGSAISSMEVTIGILTYRIRPQPVGDLLASFVQIGQAAIIGSDDTPVGIESLYFARARQPLPGAVGDQLVWIQADVATFWSDPNHFPTYEMFADPAQLLTGTPNQLAMTIFNCTLAALRANNCTQSGSRFRVIGQFTSVRKILTKRGPSGE